MLTLIDLSGLSTVLGESLAKTIPGRGIFAAVA